MKNIAKYFNISKLLIITLTVLMTFSIISCPEPDNGNGDEDSDGTTTASSGNTLTLSGRVTLEEYNYNDDSFSYSPFNGNLTIIDPYGGSGQVTNGNLSYTIGTPLNLVSLDFKEMFGEGILYDNIKSSRNVRGGVLSLLTNYNNYYLFRGTGKNKDNLQNNTLTQEGVGYFYVENDVTVTGKGIVDTRISEHYGTDTVITRDINLVFKAGWNIVYVKAETSETGQNETRIRITTITMSLSNPSHLMWILSYYPGGIGL